MRNRRIARVVGLACVMSTLVLSSACSSSGTEKTSSTVRTAPDTAAVTLPSGTTPGTLAVNAIVPLTADVAGAASGDKDRLTHLIANGVSVALVPVVDGVAASPLTSALASVQFAPNPGRNGTWKVSSSTPSLRVARMVGDDRTSGSFTTAGAKGCASAGDTGDCVGTLSIDVTAELSPVAAARVAAQFEKNPGAMAIVFSNSSGRSIAFATAANGTTSSDGRRTVRLEPGRTLTTAAPSSRVRALDAIVDAAFGPVSARVRPASLGSTRPTARNAVADTTTSPNLVLTQSSSGSGCGSVMTTTSAGLGIASGFLGFVPVVGPALNATTQAAGAGLALMGGNAGDACIQAQFDLINTQLADQEGQIQNLQVQYALQQNEIYQLMVDGAQAQTNLDLTNYNNALQAISPSESGGAGIFGGFMVNLGFWNSNYTAVPGASIAGSASGQSFVSTVASSTSEAATFAANLNSFSGSMVDVTACSSTGCPQSAVTANPSSSVVMLWSSEAQQLQALTELARSQVGNVVPYFDQYNNTIAEQFQNSLGVLQQAFSLEAMVNQLNYDHATMDCSWGQTKECTMIDSFGGVPGTLYSYCQSLTDGACPATSTATETTAYNQAQYRLAQVYAWRVGLLYDAALSFLFTDAPLSPQGYPTTTATGTIAGRAITSAPVPYATLLGSALGGIAGVAATRPMGVLPGAATGGGSTWQTNGVLYQYSGLFDANGCANTIMAANQSGGASAPPPANPCPPAIFLTGQGGAVNQASYTGNALQPYTNVGGSVVLSGVLQANLLMCNPGAANLGWYTPPSQNTNNAAGLVLGQWYLNCGNWAIITNSTGCFPGASCPLAWSDPVSGYSWLPSGYYAFGQPGSQFTFQMDFELSPESVTFAGASGCGTAGAVFYSSGTNGQNYQNSTSTCYLSMTVKNNSSMQGVTGMVTKNQAGSGSGLQIPMMWSQSQDGKDYSYWYWEPQQVASSDMGAYGFTCSGWTCTMVDGSQWTITAVPATNDPSCSDCNAVEILNLGLSQVS